MSDVVLSVRVTPRSGRTEITGVDDDGILRIRVSATPVDGAANAAAVRLVAAELHVPPSSVEVVSGASSRHKRLRVHGSGPARVLERWPGLALGGDLHQRGGTETP
jgi:uncharacterized protein